MPIKTRTIKAEGISLTLPDDMSKAEWARALLDKGVSVSTIAKVVPMSYSQVHSIAKKEGTRVDLVIDARGDMSRTKVTSAKKLPPGEHKATLRSVKIEPASPAWGELPPPPRKATKPKGQVKANPKIGKLRTPGLPSDIAVGDCANCGYDLVVRSLPTGFTLVHTNISAEEFLATIQFCQAVPRALWE